MDTVGACGRVGCTHSPQPTPMVHSRHACTCTTPHMYLYLYSMDHVCALTSRRYLNAMQSPGASEKPTFSVVRRSKSLMARDRMSHACTDTGCHIRSYAWQDFTSGHMPGRMSHQVTCLTGCHMPAPTQDVTSGHMPGRMSHACTDTGCHIRSHAWQDVTSGHMPAPTQRQQP